MEKTNTPESKYINIETDETECISTEIGEQFEKLMLSSYFNSLSTKARKSLHYNQRSYQSIIVNLKKNLYESSFYRINEEYYNFKHITNLDLSNNALKELPIAIENLYNLKYLNLSGNSLTSLPDSLKLLFNLSNLNISNNNFCKIPYVLYIGLKKLSALELSYNKISFFDDVPCCINNIAILKMSHNALLQIPSWILITYCHLKELDLSHNPFDLKQNTIFDYNKMKNWEFLEKLSMENCSLGNKQLQFLHSLKSLKSLCIGNAGNTSLKNLKENYLGNLNMSIFKYCRSLQCLNMKHSNISILQSDFDEAIKNVEVLNLSDNILHWLPDNFCNLINLKILYLTSNQILYLPKEINKLSNLQQLHLSNNKLHSLPSTFHTLVNLKFLDLYNNKIGNFDMMILRNKNLEGIDLGLNCIDFNTTCHSKNLQISWEKYFYLKNKFRKIFDFEASRVDDQNLDQTKAENSINIFNDYSSDSDCREDNQLNVSNSDLILPDMKITTNEDSWETKTENCERNNLFDPNEYDIEQPSVQRSTFFKLDSTFSENYCPGNSHVPSISNFYLKCCRAKTEFVEGQFDSD